RRTGGAPAAGRMTPGRGAERGEPPAAEASGEPHGAGSRSEPSTTGDLEIVFVQDAAVYDGRFANNAWLQELPDPLTKLTWDNAAVVSPRTAARFALEAGRVV